jgi:hypothetical protein
MNRGRAPEEGNTFLSLENRKPASALATTQRGWRYSKQYEANFEDPIENIR